MKADSAFGNGLGISLQAGFLAADQAESLVRRRGGGIEELMLELLGSAARFAEAPISHFPVGAVALGRSGGLYLGANIEFLGEALTFDIHAEQAATVNAWVHGERGVDSIAVTAAPCGHCRQFLNELTGATDLACLLPGRPRRLLSELLPDSFGPGDLGVKATLMEPQDHGLTLKTASRDEAVLAALKAANMSYAPYTRAFSGVALVLIGGEILAGPYAENAAFNPSVSPLESALVRLRMTGRRYSDIRRAVLVEREKAATSQSDATRIVLEAITSGIRPEIHHAR